jgi:uncharacterized protein (DUF924 family)
MGSTMSTPTNPPLDLAAHSAPDAAASVVAFWREAGPARWFAKDAAFDQGFRERFYSLHFAAAARQCDGWMSDAEGALALLLLLDQFPRNAFRGTAHMFATDALACSLALQAIEAGLDQQVEPALRLFFYLPLMHSEQLADQQHCVALCQALGEPSIGHAGAHLDVVQRFGRFPHRNPVLGRQTTAQEAAFLQSGGFAG